MEAVLCQDGGRRLLDFRDQIFWELMVSRKQEESFPGSSGDGCTAYMFPG